jgi:aryl-alcohol dehydrogenase-like predicted oxidoreductase
MQYTNLGTTGLKISRIGLGCMSYGDPGWRSWVLDEAAARPHFRNALEAGINFFDTADMYSNGVSEEVTGRLLKEMASREDYVLATKVFFPLAPGPNRSGLSRKHVLASLDASLERLGHDYVDLYQIHRWDPATPIEETLDVLDTVVRSGRVRYLGASSMAAWQFSKALYTAREHGWHRFVSMQNHYNLVYREEEREMIPLCLDQGVGVIPWSPLARGFLTGSRTRESMRTTTRANDDEYADKLYYKEDDFRVLDAVFEVSRARGVTPAQIAFAWVASRPGIDAPIVGVTKEKHLEDLLAALEIDLTPEEIERLEAPYTPRTIYGFKNPTPEEMKGRN